MRSILVLAFVLCVLAERRRYDGYKVLDIVPETKQQVDHVHSLSNDIDLDFWTESPIIGLSTQVMVPPHRINDVVNYLKLQDVPFKITEDNFQSQIDAEISRLEARFSKRNPGTNAYNPNDFNTFEDIEAELPLMAGRCSGAIECEVSSIGQSVQGRELWLLTIHSGQPGKQIIWIDSTIHAREWLAPATVLNIMDYMTRHYGEAGYEDVTYLIDTYDWYFVPVMNPDGYVYSWDSDRMWRKSRNVNQGSSCIGTDLNRNYDVNWGKVGVSTNPCSDTYLGSSAASEPETQAVQAKTVELGDSLDAFVTFHTAATMWLIPWGHSDGTPPQCVFADDHEEMMAILNPTVDAVQETHGDLSWARGNSCETIYATSGTTMDYAKHIVPGLPISITPELRGSFVMPPESIPISFEENWNGIVKLAEVVQARKSSN